MYKGFWGWSLENSGSGTVDTKYTIEYVDNAKTWERICYIDDHYSEIEKCQESWELYSKLEFDNVTEALTCYMTKLVSDKCYDIKMLEQVFVNGDMVLEQYIEPKSTLRYSMRTAVNYEMEVRMHKTRASIRPAYLFGFAPSNYEYKKPTPFGYVYNVSSGLKCDPTKFSVIRQVKCDIK